MTRAERVAQFETQEAEFEAAMLRREEWVRITRTLDALYRAKQAGNHSVLINQKIARYEALQQALMGFPEALGRLD